MRLILLIISISFIASCSQKSKSLIPPSPSIPLDSIQHAFYSTYTLTNLKYRTIAFEKRRDGYHIGTYTDKNGKFIVDKTYLFYSDSLKKFLDLPLEKITDPEEIKEQLTRYSDTSQNNNYRVNYYYGYEGWYDDVIAALEDRNDLTEEQLYSLGRAYAASANGLLNQNYEFTNAAKTFPTALVPDVLSKDQLDKYYKEIAKAQATYLALKERNPRFETAVGPIGIKYANEIMTQFHQTLVYADKQKDAMKLPDNLYPDSMITNLKKVLDACDTNAILVSFSDNDFYPVLYVQQKLHHRKDVYLVNSSLLGVDRYIARATYPQFSSPGIKMSTDTTFYKGSLNDYFFFEHPGVPVTMPDFFEVLRRNIGNESPTTIIHNSLFQLDPKIPMARFYSSYMVKSDWVLLDIIYNLKGRKIYFQKPGYGIEFLDELLEKGELVDRYKY